MISECLHIGLPVLAKPVAGQSEQLGNAATLRQLELASIMTSLDAGVVGNWLEQRRAPEPQDYPDVAAAICEWLLEGDWQNRDTLVDSLWQQRDDSARLNCA